MDFSLFLIPTLRPFTDWCIISGSWYFAKYCLENQFIKGNPYIKWYEKLIYLLFIGVPAFMIASLISILLENDYKLSIYFAIMIPALLSCYWYMAKQNAKVTEEIKELVRKENLLK